VVTNYQHVILKIRFQKKIWAINKAKAQETMEQQSKLNTKSNIPEGNKTSSSNHQKKAGVEQMSSSIKLMNGSTVDLFCNLKLVTNIWTTSEMLDVLTNGGKLFTNQRATVPN
jgi:hypothetical protein